LPSVDFALLPHEVRAIRMQRRAAAGAVVSLLLLLGGLTYGKRALPHMQPHSLPDEDAEAALVHAPSASVLIEASPGHLLPIAPPSASSSALPPTRRSTETTRSSAHAAPVPSGDTAAQEGGRTEFKFGRAKSFSTALIQCGASPDEAREVVAALQKIVDFRRGKPEDRLIFERDADQLLRVFEYRASVTEVYRAVRNEHGALHGLRVDIPVEHRRIAKGTFIAGTLGHSLDALGLGSSLAGLVTEAFDSRISFTRDTREGDSVKLIMDEEYVDGAFLRYGTVHAIEYTSERAGKLQAFWYEPERGTGDFYDASGRALHGGWLRTPVRYDHISSPYNLKRRHPILKRIMPHLGVDYSASVGTPVWAAADGQVTFAGPRGPNGNLVSVRHSAGYESHYAHLWKIAADIKPGAQLKQHQVIGFVGSTGRSTGPHLHFALKRNGRFLDPATQLNGMGEPLPNAAQPRFRAAVDQLRSELEHVSPAPAPSADTAPKVVEDAADDEDDLDL
jgi:murein DD-endopeptidase MepM/ murein hydrolase activator NlpD